ncbi:DNA starvation/stationary phase protection protein [Sphingobacterium kitahiroshimense]|uniref:Dps family protein n=1 Tax=Sphingobacterium sp. B16(2022) TaxID=2914044 RepID=UPI00143B728D|nr:DNA starvation/stationary phase protection protein [Sphingobacterium sp. B16(2022)]NJI72274.1 DNA starvation/stationary phase protection protein [Sphingobacterium sp. B16(2022)]
MKTKIGISDQHTQTVAKQLAPLLADEFILYIKTGNAHWNVTEDNLYSNHIFFEGQYKQLNELIDNGIEKMRAITHYAPATTKIYLNIIN